jgi:hypothetical protein
MRGLSRLRNWGLSEQTKAVVVVMVLLFFASHTADIFLYWRGIDVAHTFSNDILIAVLGGAALWFFLTLQAERQEMARARERILLTAELNHHIRNSVTVLANAVLLRDEAERLGAVDEAIQQIDRVLTELVPTANLDREPRFFLDALTTRSSRSPSRVALKRPN